MAYARSGGMLFSKRAKRQGEGRHERGDQADDEGQDQEVQVRRAVLGETEEELVLRVDLDVELELVDEEDDAGEQERERRQARIEAAAAEDDAEADSEEARDEKEVAEEADELDVRRDPADQHQLDEEDYKARQE